MTTETEASPASAPSPASPEDPEKLIQFTPRVPRALLTAIDETAEKARLSRNEWVLRVLSQAVGLEAPLPNQAPRPASPAWGFAVAITRLYVFALAGELAPYQAALADALHRAGTEPEALELLARAQQEAGALLLARSTPPTPTPNAPTPTDPQPVAHVPSQRSVRTRYKQLLAHRQGGRTRAIAHLRGYARGSAACLDRFAAGKLELPAPTLAALAAFLEQPQP